METVINGNQNFGNKGKYNIVQFDQLDNRIQTILKEAVEARTFSYSPYSKFKVGACIEAEDGGLYKGCNIENASYPVGTCAERCAYGKAISEGKLKFKAIGIVANQEKFFTTPCGFCRQFMSEFGDIQVYMGKPDLKEILISSVGELLPLSFQINSDYSF